MDVKEFLEQYNHFPYSNEKIAKILAEEIDDLKIKTMAQNYIKYGDELEEFLDNIGFEFG